MFNKGSTTGAPIVMNDEASHFPDSLREELGYTAHTEAQYNNQARDAWARANNGYNDPLTHFLIIDALMRVAPTKPVRAKPLVQWLSIHRPQLVWDTKTVGRVLGELDELAYEVSKKSPPISSTHSGRGACYWVDITPEAAIWLNTMRDKAYKKYQKRLETKAEAIGKYGTRTHSIWSEDE